MIREKEVNRIIGRTRSSDISTINATLNSNFNKNQQQNNNDPANVGKSAATVASEQMYARAKLRYYEHLRREKLYKQRHLVKPGGTYI